MLLKMYSLGFQVRKFKFKWCGNVYILFLSISPRIPLAFRVILCHYSIDSTASSSSAVLSSKWSWQKRTLCPLWACPCYVAYVSCESSKSPSKSEHLHLMRSSTLSKCVAWMEWRRSMCEIFLLFLMKITFLRMFFFSLHFSVNSAAASKDFGFRWARWAVCSTPFDPSSLSCPFSFCLYSSLPCLERSFSVVGFSPVAVAISIHPGMPIWPFPR